MKYQEIKGFSDAELEEKLKSEQESLEKMKFTHEILKGHSNSGPGKGGIENPMKIRESRKLVARFLTEINARKKAK